MKRRKSLLFIGAAIVCSLPLGSKADFSGFVDQLRQSNIPIDKILTQTGITRYEITRLLNATECKDCINPDNSYLKTYTAPYWTKFTQTPGKDFDDISYAQAMFKNKSYYYCVAYVGENGYMRGYPADTSPICAGQFCGTRQATKAEFLQIVMNMISKYIYSSYALNWQEVKTWLSKLDSNGYQYKNFSSTDIQTISDKAKTCKTQSCLLENSNDLNIYLKYCTFNLQACGMASVGPIKEGSWPVAELNLLSKQQIINLDDAAKFNIGDLIDGQLVIKIFANMNDLIGCAFINDYDCDGIPNSQDSCPNVYNPHQTDTDKDGIGDVCDDDIDGDGAKNPIGIVDDNGRIVIRLWDKTMDNCLFVKNTDQKHGNSRIGNACSISDNLSLAISITNPDIKTNHTISFTAVYKNAFKEYSRDFGDGSFGFGEKASHTYQKPGTYTVRLIAKTDSGKQSLARSSVIIGHPIDEERAVQPVLNTLSFQNNSSIDLSLSTIGKVDYFEWSFGDALKIQSQTASLTKVFRTEASIPVTIKGIKDNQVVSANTFTIAIGNSKGTLLNASLLNPDKGETVYFSSKIAGFSEKDIQSVVWNFGDEEFLQTDALSINHVYKVSGQKAVVQTITLRDGTIFKNILTLYVVSPYFCDSYTLSFVPQMESDLIHPLKFTTIIFGSFDTPLFFSNIYGDSQSQNFGTRAIRSPFASEHRYISPGIYYPQTTLMINTCTSLSAQATVDIQGSDICLDAKLNNTLNKLGCDTDKDGIPDICDDDIDGDGKPNLLGIIVDPKTCDSTKKNQSQGLNKDILNKHFQGVCSLDNDPFNSNPDQTDNNNNNIGDALDAAQISGSGNTTSDTNFLDSDNDGIPDSQDLCPTLAENYNGIQDTDGCPEIGSELNCENTQFPTINGDWWNTNSNLNGNGGTGSNSGTIPGSPSCGNGIQEANENCFSCPQDSQGCLMIMTQECLQCPCPFADFSADLTNGDLVKAILWDKTKKYPWSYSVGYEIGY